MGHRSAMPTNEAYRRGISGIPIVPSAENPNNGIAWAKAPDERMGGRSGDQSRRRRSDSGGIPQPRHRAHHVIAGIGMVAGMGSAGAAEDQQPPRSGFHRMLA